MFLSLELRFLISWRNWNSYTPKKNEKVVQNWSKKWFGRFQKVVQFNFYLLKFLRFQKKSIEIENFARNWKFWNYVVERQKKLSKPDHFWGQNFDQISNFFDLKFRDWKTENVSTSSKTNSGCKSGPEIDKKNPGSFFPAVFFGEYVILSY